MAEPPQGSARHLVIVLGDQLDRGSAAFDGFDAEADVVWMAEVRGEATHVPSHKVRIAVFLSAMRHFRDDLRERGVAVHYRALDDPDNRGSLADELIAAVQELKPERLIVVRPGEWRVQQSLTKAAREAGIELEIRPDRHFLCSTEEFAEHAEGRRQLLMEHFYRWMRKKHDVLLEDGEPAGGEWNFDAENRESFGKSGPEEVPGPMSFSQDETTRKVIRLVEEQFPDHWGSLAHFDWPVTRRQAGRALRDFIDRRLPRFGDYQDAMWTGEPFLYHSRLSSALNLKLLDPRKAIEVAIRAWREGEAPINAVEGFVRQILGWREFVRGIYWRFMPDYAERNTFGADLPLPGFYWNTETDMNCLRCCIGQTLEYGYAHHIQRLMVTGLFALLLGVEPRQVHEWYLAIYLDAVEWVEMPNTIGMSQYADDGVMATKPYAASGKYIQRMSNYCKDCRFDPSRRTVEDACPFTTLYWDFLSRNRNRLEANPRMGLQIRNLDRIDDSERRAIRKRARRLKSELTG